MNKNNNWPYYRNIREVKPPKPFKAIIYHIYAIRPEVENKYPGRMLYIGSTKLSLKQRFAKHLTYTRKKFEKRYGIHQFMAEEGINNFAIGPLEELDGCLSQDQMREMEEELIQIYKPVFNINSSSVSANMGESPFLKQLLLQSVN